MTYDVLPQPIHTGAEASRGSSGVPEGYQEQHDRVVQILKDRVNRYDKSRRSPDHSRKPIFIPEDEVSDGHWHITAEGLRDDVYTYSIRLVEDELDALKHRNPYAYAIIDSVFHVDAGHTDYEVLREQAETSPTAAAKFQDLRVALYLLVSRLLDKELYAKPPARILNHTNRTRTMEEWYAEYYRVFRGFCEELKPKHKRYRNKAIQNTAVTCDVAKSTVQRAISFHESGEKYTQVARSFKKGTKSRCQEKITSKRCKSSSERSSESYSIDSSQT